eukprot:c29221_g1_i1 orf=269-3925(-)
MISQMAWCCSCSVSWPLDAFCSTHCGILQPHPALHKTSCAFWNYGGTSGSNRFLSFGGLKVMLPPSGRKPKDRNPPGLSRRVVVTPRHFKFNSRCQVRQVKLRLKLNHQVQFGEHHALLGSAPWLGSWKDKVMMRWTESGWVVDLEANAGERIEYKYIFIPQNGDIVWEGGANRVLDIPKEGSYELLCHWDNTHESSYMVNKDDGESNGSVKVTEEQPQNISVRSERREFSISSGFVQEWQGRGISFMQSNEHARQKDSKRDTFGLEGPALYIVKGDQNANNWWRKLDIVRDLLTGDMIKANRLEILLNVAIYLKWINTGQIQCYEDGGHHRPNRHAEISRLIFRELERMCSDKGLESKELIVIRKIHPCLPSFKSEFTTSVPLTRIRDIAHRNDIPHDLKQEIKHTIQNKLHRNAGPEDLVATEMLLARVTKNSGQYSEAFIEQLKIFYNELKDFFNASSLTEQLESVRPSLDENKISVLDNFLTQKKKLDESGECTNNGSATKGTDTLISTMHALTTIRAVLLKGLESGLRNDASDNAIAMRQKWRLSEIGLEDYFFVLLSSFINAIETGGGANLLSKEAQRQYIKSWNHPLGAVVLGVRQLGLSGWKQAECMAIENEIKAWESMGLDEAEVVEERTIVWALRLKATLDRARRLSESYSDTLLYLYPKHVKKLGNAFGIPENTIRTYTEGEIRASVVFQLSKLCSLLLKAMRMITGGGGWDPLVSGTAIGILVEVDRIVPTSLPASLDGPIILLVKEADGDEEVKAAGQNIVGVVLLQELPHLSHLGVRARQEKVIFVTCEDDDEVTNIRAMIGCPVKLDANAETVRVSIFEGKLTAEKELVAMHSESHPDEKEYGDKRNTGSTIGILPKTVSTYQSKVAVSPAIVLDLAKADIEKTGAKAASCGHLARLADQSKTVYSDQGVPAAFSVPAGSVIPFGAMEAAIESSGSAQKFYSLIEKAESAQVEGGELDHVCLELQLLVAAQRPPKSVIDELATRLPDDARLIVRSSANVEDLAGMSGAGLYESIPNVKASELDTFGKAVAEVWASLYTRRAILSRRVAGVSQKAASMAILVQELLSPELSFVLHTVSPLDQNVKVVEAEVAAGLGETLAAGTRGTPWRIAGHKFNGHVKTLAFANFSEELVVQSGGAADGRVMQITVDYSKKPLTINSKYRHQLGQQLATIGFLLEQSFGSPQDVEGCIVEKEVFIVQSRPQP